MANNLIVTLLEEEKECDTCGWNYSTGYIIEYVTSVGVLVIEKNPSADCRNLSSYDEEDLINDIAILTTGQPADIRHAQEGN